MFLLLIRVLNALWDPIIGWLADRFAPAFGRRRSFFIGSIPITLLSNQHRLLSGDTRRRAVR
ncbi:MFS transporter [Phyllobacterium sp. 1468]|uniref:MFS transporter n=1 Tax=Phyllobacterium sp. 1468 TaxID=2817759 RepID=UPI00386218C8